MTFPDRWETGIPGNFMGFYGIFFDFVGFGSHLCCAGLTWAGSPPFTCSPVLGRGCSVLTWAGLTWVSAHLSHAGLTCVISPLTCAGLTC